MEKVGDLMRDLGFKEDGDDEVKKAFVRNLIRAAFPDGKVFEKPALNEDKQLQFVFDSEVSELKSS